MEIDIKDVSPALFIDAVAHLLSIGVSTLSVFADRRQTEGPWLTAFVIVDGKRHVRWTGDDWQGRTLQEQARALAVQLQTFDPGSQPVDAHL